MKIKERNSQRMVLTSGIGIFSNIRKITIDRNTRTVAVESHRFFFSRNLRVIPFENISEVLINRKDLTLQTMLDTDAFVVDKKDKYRCDVFLCISDADNIHITSSGKHDKVWSLAIQVSEFMGKEISEGESKGLW